MKFPVPYKIDYSNRDPEFGVDELFYQRWSPRSWKKTSIPDEVVATISRYDTGAPNYWRIEFQVPITLKIKQ